MNCVESGGGKMKNNFLKTFVISLLFFSLNTYAATQTVIVTYSMPNSAALTVSPAIYSGGGVLVCAGGGNAILNASVQTPPSFVTNNINFNTSINWVNQNYQQCLNYSAAAIKSVSSSGNAISFYANTNAGIGIASYSIGGSAAYTFQFNLGSLSTPIVDPNTQTTYTFVSCNQTQAEPNTIACCFSSNAPTGCS